MMSSRVFLVLLVCCVSTVLCSTGIETSFRADSAVEQLQRVHSRVTPGQRSKKGRAVGGGGGGRKTERNGSGCSWDKDAESCDVSKDAVSDLLGKSDDAYANYIAKFEVCDAAKDKKDCEAAGHCVWDANPQMKTCVFAHYFRGHEDSPCLVDAPALAKVVEHGVECATNPDQFSCESKMYCEWDADEDECSGDFLYDFLGFGQGEYGDILQGKIQALIKPFATKFQIQEPHFDWSSILEWKIPETACPADASENACKFADVVLGYQMPPLFYCQLKYGSFFQFPDCLQDPLCSFDFGQFSCTADDAPLKALLGSSYKDFSETIEHEDDKEFLHTVGVCLEHKSKEECIGPCLYFKSGGYCGYPDTSAFTLMLEPDKDLSDPVCSFIKMSVDSGCLDLESRETCTSNANCYYEDDDECVPSLKYMIESVLEKDADVKASYEELKKGCSAFTTGEDCDPEE